MSFSNETSPRQLKGVIDRASSTGGKKPRMGKERRGSELRVRIILSRFSHLLVSAFSST